MFVLLIEYACGGDVSTYGDMYSYGILLLEMFTCKRPTDALFIDGLTLHGFAKEAFPDEIERIVDPSLIPHNHGNRIVECLNSIFQIGVTCSSEVAGERMNIHNVVVALQGIKQKLVNP